jgi:hypothetical protein
MRCLLLALLLLAGCAGDMKGKWPTLAPRPGEISADGAALPTCPGCGADMVAKPVPPVVAPLPLPADVGDRLAAATSVIADVEAKAPAQARRADAAIAAARADPARSGDAEVERSRFEALFLPLAIEERRLDALADDIAGRDGAEAVMAQIAALRARLVALETLRGSVGG